MPGYGAQGEDGRSRRDWVLAGLTLLAAFAVSYLPDGAQQRVAWAIRATALRPFVATQERVSEARMRATQAEALRAQLDSLIARTATQEALVDENRTLRGLLGLGERLGPSFRPATVVRPGTPGSESMFLLFLGAEHGVRAGAPVVDRHGLVGVVREVRARTSVGMDWTHPDFRASAMLADGSVYGIVEPRAGRFREDDRLILNGAAYYERVAEGTPVLTSGLGGIFPRGIPIGFVDGVAEVQGRWRKSYWVRPMVEVGGVTHVLVQVQEDAGDLGFAWPPDSLRTAQDAVLQEEGARR